MVSVADDLGAWLVAVLADAGRKKLAQLVLGTDQERALREASAAAVGLTARELRPGDREQADQLALVMNQVFSQPVPGEPLAGHLTVLQALQAGIAEQFEALDDASVTGTGQSSSDLLGVTGTVLAEKLTANLGSGRAAGQAVQWAAAGAADHRGAAEWRSDAQRTRTG